MNEQLERAQLLARFKLNVKRSLNESVDLEKLTREPAYARQRLAEIEEAASEEELLVMVLRLREIFVPRQASAPEVIEKTGGREMRDYKLGARSW